MRPGLIATGNSGQAVEVNPRSKSWNCYYGWPRRNAAIYRAARKDVVRAALEPAFAWSC